MENSSASLNLNQHSEDQIKKPLNENEFSSEKKFIELTPETSQASSLKHHKTSVTSKKRNKSKISEKPVHRSTTHYMSNTKSKYKLMIRPPGMQKSVLIRDMQITPSRSEATKLETEIKPFRRTLAPASPGVFNYGFSHRMMAFDDYRANRPLPKLERHVDSRMLAKSAAGRASQYVHKSSIAFPEMPIYKHFVDKTMDRPIKAPPGYRFKCAVCQFQLEHCECPGKIVFF